ncbi:MAG: YHS domain-containing protein [Planctomycetes bacterium]|nr:YHS domain-containing protein [Planctomycetota bacterium]
MLTRLFLLLLLFVPVTLSAAEVKPYPLATCIVSGDKIDPSVPAVVHNGQQVKFCCKACVKKFQANPEKYLIKLPKK